ncbi:pilus assembly protein [Epibacterium sp. SM1979]|uniref:Pilus assembly protein n=1 Tax=Tritonibacter litoralis TaxID=2662264 RepID=A0A843YI43_9RHOB|nr:pilus assembly protein [Tritonibacter litoralis]MQQ08893.1 pilus assembly protein [Tritonibacter litoralis]
MRKLFSQKAKRFASDTEGSITVEFAIYLPLILFIFAVIVTFFDAFRQESINLKAAYTVSDLISRETQELNEDYIDSMQNMAELLVRPDSVLSLRVTIVRWDEDDDRYYVDWSRVRGQAYAQLNDSSVEALTTRLPNMPDQERVILVETHNQVTPVFPFAMLDVRGERFDQDEDVLLEKSLLDIETFVFTRPRFAPLVRFEGEIIPGPAHDDFTNETI